MVTHNKYRQCLSQTSDEAGAVCAESNSAPHESLRAGSLQAPTPRKTSLKHYNCGDLNAVIFNHDASQLPNFINTTLPPHEQATAQEIDSYFRQELIYKRNERMGRRVMALLRENGDKSFFFAFGAGHFLGNNTVIDVLRQAGFEVEHTPPGKAVHSSSPRSSQPPSPDPVVTPAPTMPPMEHSSSPSLASTPPGPGDEEEEDEDPLSPHLLLSDSLSQLEEFGRQKKWRRKHHKQHRPRQFNDLWVRIEDSTTTAPSPFKTTDSYDTAKPPIRFAKQLEHRPPPAPPEPPGPSRNSAPFVSPLTPFLLITTGTIVLHIVQPS
ncbi:metalloprotease TIKI2-like [Dromiciops gliroides]|uniref:metalloprotease TIKI2-like n=1 Tax=Dromiciops gliroides TaxID=33562 RepID=UPI001CC5F659|nr:metalloprotease TIKI2-like [Dromiciops gliroides]